MSFPSYRLLQGIILSKYLQMKSVLRVKPNPYNNTATEPPKTVVQDCRFLTSAELLKLKPNVSRELRDSRRFLIDLFQWLHDCVASKLTPGEKVELGFSCSSSESSSEYSEYTVRVSKDGDCLGRQRREL
jgi:hypothetical protein